MKRNKAYRFRIYPNKRQKILINKTFGCSRYVYNYFLILWKRQYEETGAGLGYNKCSSMLTQLKKEENKSWLKEVDSTALQSSLRNLDNAYQRFFKKNSSYPKLKSKKNAVQSYTSKVNIGIEGNKIKLPKLGKVKLSLSKEVKGRILNATIRKKPSGKYFVSIIVEEDIEYIDKANSVIGIDLGIKDFAILSNGVIYENPQYYRKLEKKLAKEIKELQRKKKGSANREKQRIALAKVYERIANARKDYLQKISTELVKNHDIICIEDLQVTNMVKNHKLAKCISEVSWGEFRRMLEYKCEWYGKELVVISTSFPSSQLCSKCGFRNRDAKKLRIRSWNCPECLSEHDRDINASKNILNEGLRMISER